MLRACGWWKARVHVCVEDWQQSSSQPGGGAIPGRSAPAPHSSARSLLGRAQLCPGPTQHTPTHKRAVGRARRDGSNAWLSRAPTALSGSSRSRADAVAAHTAVVPATHPPPPPAHCGVHLLPLAHLCGHGMARSAAALKLACKTVPRSPSTPARAQVALLRRACLRQARSFWARGGAHTNTRSTRASSKHGGCDGRSEGGGSGRA